MLNSSFNSDRQGVLRFSVTEVSQASPVCGSAVDKLFGCPNLLEEDALRNIQKADEIGKVDQAGAVGVAIRIESVVHFARSEIHILVVRRGERPVRFGGPAHLQ